MNYQRHRLHDVVGVVSQRLMEIRRFQAAGELHESVDDVQGEGEGGKVDGGTKRGGMEQRCRRAIC
jgi:hypothetical protein